ncbi:MAG: hypothetical protein HN719_02435, partial [Alphaproteobacteria bacterium]|nr:hypothetical protein [Alphaproteobacteria bacterium]
MHDFGFLNSKCAFPKAASAEMAELGLERWHECAWEAEKAEKSGLADFAANMSDNALGRQLLDAVFGNSPFLGSVMLKDPAFVRRLIEQGPDSIQSEILTTLGKSGAEQESDGALARCLR